MIINNGDIITARHLSSGKRFRLEVTEVSEDYIVGLLPYASTYTSGGTYEGSYRGSKVIFSSQVVSVDN